MNKKRDKRAATYPQNTRVHKAKGKPTVVYHDSVIKKDLNDYSYSKDIDEKVLKLAMSLAERFAINIIRETMGRQMDMVIDKVTDKLVGDLVNKMPTQQVVIKEVVSESTPEIKKELQDFDFGAGVPNVDRSKGLKLKGKASKKSTSTDTTDDALDVLDSLNK